MTRGFREQFASQIDFHIIDAPFELDPEITPPEDQLLEKGFKIPFRSWMDFRPNIEELMEEKRRRGEKEELKFEDMLIYRGIEKSSALIADVI